MSCASQRDCLLVSILGAASVELWGSVAKSVKGAKSAVSYAGVLHSPASFSDLVLTYKAGNEMPDILERHIIELAEAEVILKLQVGSLGSSTERSNLKEKTRDALQLAERPSP